MTMCSHQQAGRTWSVPLSFYPEDGFAWFFRNVCKYHSAYKTLCPKRYILNLHQLKLYVLQLETSVFFSGPRLFIRKRTLEIRNWLTIQWIKSSLLSSLVPRYFSIFSLDQVLRKKMRQIPKIMFSYCEFLQLLFSRLSTETCCNFLVTVFTAHCGLRSNIVVVVSLKW